MASMRPQHQHPLLDFTLSPSSATGRTAGSTMHMLVCPTSKPNCLYLFAATVCMCIRQIATMMCVVCPRGKVGRHASLCAGETLFPMPLKTKRQEKFTFFSDHSSSLLPQGSSLTSVLAPTQSGSLCSTDRKARADCFLPVLQATGTTPQLPKSSIPRKGVPIPAHLPEPHASSSGPPQPGHHLLQIGFLQKLLLPNLHAPVVAT